MLPACGQRVAAVSTRTVWVLGGLVLAFVLALGSALVAYAGASAEARLLGAQLDTALAAVVVYEDQRTAAVATTDSILAASDSVVAASVVAVADARATTDAAVRDSEAAFRSAVALAEDNPTLERAIEEMRAEQIVETMAWEVERAEHLAAAFALTQQIRTMTTAFRRERTAWEVEADGLRAALSLSQQEASAWQRAAAPGMLKQVWQQGRAALVVGVLVLTLAR